MLNRIVLVVVVAAFANACSAVQPMAAPASLSPTSKGEDKAKKLDESDSERELGIDSAPAPPPPMCGAECAEACERFGEELAEACTKAWAAGCFEKPRRDNATCEVPQGEIETGQGVSDSKPSDDGPVERDEGNALPELFGDL